METVAYRSVSDLSKSILKNICKIPNNIDLVVGIPRSGMLPANLISLYLNKPYTDINSFLEGKIYACGDRGKFIKKTEIKNILVVDDSIAHGYAINRAKEQLKNEPFNFIYFVVYARTKSKDKVNTYCELLDGERIFEWNLFHHQNILERSCLDIDGVLCRDPLPEENDDGEKYHKFLLTAEPKFIPTVKIKTLISCRLEKYRNETMFWLKKHNIEYENLILLNLPNKEARVNWGKYGEYKANEYKKPQYIFFIESSLKEAQTIKEKTGKSVFCIENMSLI